MDLCTSDSTKRRRLDHPLLSRSTVTSLLKIDDDCMRTIADFLGRSYWSLKRVCQSCWSSLQNYSLHLHEKNTKNFLDSTLDNHGKVRYIKLETSAVKTLKNVLDVANVSELCKLTLSIPAPDDTHRPEMLLKKYKK